MLKRNNKGFTLPEIIVVVAIVAILATVISVAFTSYTEKSRQKTDAEIMNNVAHECEIYVLEKADDKNYSAIIRIDENGAVTFEDGSTNVADGIGGANAKDTTSLKTVIQNKIEADKFQSNLYRGKGFDIAVIDESCQWGLGYIMDPGNPKVGNIKTDGTDGTDGTDRTPNYQKPTN